VTEQLKVRRFIMTEQLKARRFGSGPKSLKSRRRAQIYYVVDELQNSCTSPAPHTVPIRVCRGYWAHTLTHNGGALGEKQHTRGALCCAVPRLPPSSTQSTPRWRPSSRIPPP